MDLLGIAAGHPAAFGVGQRDESSERATRGQSRLIETIRDELADLAGAEAGREDESDPIAGDSAVRLVSLKSGGGKGAGGGERPESQRFAGGAWGAEDLFPA